MELTLGGRPDRATGAGPALARTGAGHGGSPDEAGELRVGRCRRMIAGWSAERLIVEIGVDGADIAGESIGGAAGEPAPVLGRA